MIKKILILFVFVSVFISGCKNTSDSNVQIITAEEMYKALEYDNIQIVDVRTQEEFNESNLKNSHNICVTDDDFVEKVLHLNKNKPIYVYCRSGKRSSQAVEILQNLGFKEIFHFSGGIKEWEEKDLENTKS